MRGLSSFGVSFISGSIVELDNCLVMTVFIAPMIVDF